MVVYLDDILLYSTSEEEHIKLVGKVVAKLKEHQLAVLVTKSGFHKESVEFLGYIVTTNGVTMSKRKVESIKMGKPRGRLRLSRSLLDSQTSTDDSSRVFPISAHLSRKL